MDWVIAIGTILLVLAVVAAAIIRKAAKHRAAGEDLSFLDIALAFAQGIDDAKDVLGPDAKQRMTGSLKRAAEDAGKHDQVTTFLERFGFNQKTNQPTQ